MNGRERGLADFVEWQVVLVVPRFIHEFKVEVLGQVCAHDSQISFCKSLSEADAPTAVEGTPRVRVAFLAGRRLAQSVIGVKPAREELSRSLPLGSAHVESGEVHDKGVALSEKVLAKLGILGYHVHRARGNGRGHPQRFTNDHIQIV